MRLIVRIREIAGKAHPHEDWAADVLLVPARRLRADPSNCLAFEDPTSGFEAAAAAGMSVIAVPDPNIAHLPFPGAQRVLDGVRPVAMGIA